VTAEILRKLARRPVKFDALDVPFDHLYNTKVGDHCIEPAGSFL
jgi:hypothetical protein